jgi:plasmid stabilization system protein ParE
VSWFDGLFGVIDSLMVMPARCAVAPESAIVGREVRCLLYRKYYRVLFAIEGEVVRIYHIRHASQQYMSREDFFAQSLLDDDPVG